MGWMRSCAMRTVGALAGASMLVLATAACTSQADDPAATETITLRIGTDDSPGVPAADQIEEFARRVEQLSNGQIAIEPVWHAAGDTSDWDQTVAQLVIGGELDLGLIPHRAWDTLGVTSLQPLSTPFLITNEDLLNEVISGALAEPLMAGLPDAGVTGLAMFPEGLRRAFAFEDGMLHPDDFAGTTLRVPTSSVSAAMYEALGATIDDARTDPAKHAGRETSFLHGKEPNTSTVPGNVALYPKVNVLVVNDAVRTALSDAQVRVLVSAGDATREWVIAATVDEQRHADEFCAFGGSIVHASAEQLRALEDATTPVVEQIANEPGNREIVDAIAALKTAQGTGVDPVLVCPEGEASLTAESALNGTYRIELTEQQLRDAGADDDFIFEWVGIQTYVFTDGVFEYDWVTTIGNPDATATNRGTYRVDGDRISLKWPGDPLETYTFTLDDDGTMHLEPYDVPDPDFVLQMTASPWVRID